MDVVNLFTVFTPVFDELNELASGLIGNCVLVIKYNSEALLITASRGQVCVLRKIS